jgi:hypothetical protein
MLAGDLVRICDSFRPAHHASKAKGNSANLRQMRILAARTHEIARESMPRMRHADS